MNIKEKLVVVSSLALGVLMGISTALVMILMLGLNV